MALREVSTVRSTGSSVDPFDAFVRLTEPRLREALSATLGSEPGRDATAEALIYAWQHWSKVQAMANPVGYLYVVGRNRGRRWGRRRSVVLRPLDSQEAPWVEPQLPMALDHLPHQQRVVVMLLYCFEWTMSEVAELLGVSKSTVQSHAERGLAALRDEMGVSHAR
jgi:RNA polymerase sigma factor (sigma-70 family)